MSSRRRSSTFGSSDLFKVPLWDRITRKNRYSSLAELAKLLTSIAKRIRSDSTEKSFEEALSRLIKLEASANDEDLHSLDIGVLVGSCLIIIFYFQDQAIMRGCMLDKSRENRLKDSFDVFDKVARRLSPQEYVQMLQTMITTVEQEEAWDREFLCVEVLLRVTNYAATGPVYISPLLDIMESMIEDNRIKNARQVIRILYELLGSNPDVHWERLSLEASDTVRRVLSIFRASVRPMVDGVLKYSPVSKGLSVCGRRLFDRLHNDDRLQYIDHLADWCLDPNLPDEAVLEFAYLLELAASRHVTQLYQDTLTPSLLYSVMRMISSDVRVVSLLGNRVLHQLLDRSGNRRAFDTPKIFYQDTSFPLQIGCYFSEDKNYLRGNRGIIHDSLLKSFLTHGYHRLNLEATYTTVCILAIEVPCGYMAAATVCMLMSLQELALRSAAPSERLRWHLHAVIMAVMSLLAWINNAVELFKYINLIMKRRADEAPHLSPPLRTLYDFAPHQVRWDRPDLFFENWEVRYGLWMHFRKNDNKDEKVDVGESSTQHQNVMM